MTSTPLIPFGPATAPAEVRILGSRVHLVSPAAIADRIEDWIANRGDGTSRRCRQVVVTGFHGLWAAHEDSQLHDILNGAEIWAPDGIAPILVAHLRGMRTAERAPGADIMQEFFHRADARGYRSYFYGDTEGVLDSLRERLERAHPGHRVAGVYSPPFRDLTPAEDEEIIGRINAARPDVLWVGLGTPKQDRWIHARLDRLQVPVAIGVGAAFGFLAGAVPRCPSWMGRRGLEWVYRFAKEPRKLWRRDLIDGPRFLVSLAIELAGLRRGE
jgi:N-acetylglucosaminyldiphosphoundecaprenol N-acetyl-beta-D-mannosaminyltransferase